MLEEGTFMAQCGLWSRMEKKRTVLQGEELEEYDELGEAKHFHRKDERTYPLIEHEYGGELSRAQWDSHVRR